MPSSSFSLAAAETGTALPGAGCPQQVFAWRREMGRAAVAAPDFVPIVAAAPMAQEVPLPPIEIELAGAVLRIAPGTEAALTTVLRAVRASVL